MQLACQKRWMHKPSHYQSAGHALLNYSFKFAASCEFTSTVVNITKCRPKRIPKPNGSRNESRYDLLLRIWEAINSERELPFVLEMLAEILRPFVTFDAIAIISFITEGEPFDSNFADSNRLYALHVVGVPPLENESPRELASRTPSHPPLSELRPRIPYPDFASVADSVLSSTPYSCNDLSSKDGWFDHEFRLASSR